ncbi:Restriction of telomere capping protein 1 [Bienertia sinuspersici]
MASRRIGSKEFKSRRNDEEDSEGEVPLKMKRKSKNKASINYVADDEDDDEEVPVKTKKASKFKSRRYQGQQVDDDEREEVRFKTTKASKYKYKSKRVSDKDDDDDEEECRLKSKKASSIKESRGEYEAEEEEKEEEEQSAIICRLINGNIDGIAKPLQNIPRYWGGGRRLLVSPAVYRDNRLSKGGHAKEKGCVVRVVRFKKQPNVNFE